jgi:hypothetical protein
MIPTVARAQWAADARTCVVHTMQSTSENIIQYTFPVVVKSTKSYSATVTKLF